MTYKLWFQQKTLWCRFENRQITQTHVRMQIIDLFMTIHKLGDRIFIVWYRDRPAKSLGMSNLDSSQLTLGHLERVPLSHHEEFYVILHFFVNYSWHNKSVLCKMAQIACVGGFIYSRHVRSRESLSFCVSLWWIGMDRRCADCDRKMKKKFP